MDTDTALTAVGPDSFEGRIDRGWWIERGPNGGYVAAIVLRAIVLAVDDPARSPRSSTVHFVAPPVEGTVRLTATVEREGRSLSTVTARMEQDGRLVAIGVARPRSRPPTRR